MAKRETLEDVIRMATRVQKRLAQQGIQLGWTLHWAPCPPEKTDKQCAGSRRKPNTKGEKK